MVHVMPKVFESFIMCSVIVALILLPRSMAQIQKRSVCGRVANIPGGAARTEALLYFGPGGFDELLPGAVTEPNGAFCIENSVRDLTERTSARLYITSFCHSDDVTLVNAPFWPGLRKQTRFAGKHIIIDRGNLTSVGDVDVQIIYGHVTLRVLNQRHEPLLTQPTDWSSVWIRVRNQNGATVHESGLSVVEIEGSVDLKESRISLALPQGTWTLEVAPAGVPPYTGTKRRSVRWLRVPGKLKIESCAKAVDVAVLVPRNTRR